MTNFQKHATPDVDEMPAPVAPHAVRTTDLPTKNTTECVENEQKSLDALLSTVETQPPSRALPGVVSKHVVPNRQTSRATNRREGLPTMVPMHQDGTGARG